MFQGLSWPWWMMMVLPEFMECASDHWECATQQNSNIWFSRINHHFFSGLYLIKSVVSIIAWILDTDCIFWNCNFWNMQFICAGTVILQQYISLYVCLWQYQWVNASFVFGLSLRLEVMRGFWNHSLGLAKRVLTFSRQTNEMPEQSLYDRAFEQNVIWLNQSSLCV